MQRQRRLAVSNGLGGEKGRSLLAIVARGVKDAGGAGSVTARVANVTGVLLDVARGRCASDGGEPDAVVHGSMVVGGIAPGGSVGTSTSLVGNAYVLQTLL